MKNDFLEQNDMDSWSHQNQETVVGATNDEFVADIPFGGIIQPKGRLVQACKCINKLSVVNVYLSDFASKLCSFVWAIVAEKRWVRNPLYQE